MVRAERARGFSPPEQIDEYRLIREIGRGAMGAVFLAEDTLLDRTVAVKFIAARRPDADKKRDFFLEARAVARLSHPNVVAVYRVGEVDDRPFLVTELVRGRSLAEVERPLDAGKLVSIAQGIARGLGAAHDKGVLHRDIKPANVMLTDEGEVKLVDFGLAKISGSPLVADRDHDVPDDARDASELVGTPLYMAPETLSGRAATVRSDLYAVGALLYELAAGVGPRDTLAEDVSKEVWIAARAIDPVLARAPSLDPRLAAIIDRCLSPDPAARFASAHELAEALAALAAPVAPALEGNPYRGLTPFEAEHRALFFGRAADARAVLDRLRSEGLVVVTGDSGVGKSSLCRAGVLPLAVDGALGDGRAYCVASLVPGRRPLAALAASLAAALDLDEIEISAHAREEPARVAIAVRAALGRDRGLVLFVDQLEELIALSDAAEVSPFLDIAMGLTALSSGVRVLFAARGDYVTRLALLPGLSDAFLRALSLVRPLSREGVRAAITGPLVDRRVTFEPPALVDTLADAGAQGGLPLLQFALSALWEARDGQTITAAALEALGGVEGALTRHADDVLDSLSPDARAAARRVLLRLITAEGTRAQRTAAELDAEAGSAREALEALVRGRLVVAGAETYEIAHEALIREWRTLQRWLSESAEQRRLLDEIEAAAALWARRGRIEEETWSGEALTHALQRIAALGVIAPPTSRAFIDAGVARRTRSARRRRWLLGAGLTASLLVAGGSTAAAVAFSRKEQQAIRQQEQIRLAAADMGEIDLILEPFDWDPQLQKPTPSAPARSLDFRFHAMASRSVGRAYGDADLRRSRRILDATSLREHVEVRSGPAFLEVVGRGDCPSAWIPVQRLPGYSDRVAGSETVLRIPVPSCQASFTDTIEIPAGEFYRAVESPEGSENWVDVIATLPGFRMDRIEVTRAAFAVYASLEALTGDAAARTSFLGLDQAGGERLPVVGVNAFTAESYCRFMGKALPTVDQWLKSMRGGVTVNGAPNPDPVRNMPWRGEVENAANIEGDKDGYANMAPVGSLPLDRSPYGIMDLGGNVAEWSREEMQSAAQRGLRVTLGPAWDIPKDHVHWRNMRPDRYLDFTIGIRCVVE